jgi:two-component system, cell cycle sensor histidine kinase and response regulator CckA
MPESTHSDFSETLWPRSHRVLFATSVFLSAVFGLLLLSPQLGRELVSSNYLPHLYCYLDKPGLVWTHVIADGLIGMSYFAISVTLGYLIYKGRREIPFNWMILAFGLFIIACGGTHLMEVVTVWIPVYVLSAGVKIVTALASLATAMVLPSTVPQVIELVHKATASEERRRLLEAALVERDRAQSALRAMNASLENKVKEGTAELAVSNRTLQAEIEERNRVEARLADLASIVEFSDDAIIATAPDGSITSWNTGAQKMYGYAARDVVGRSVSILAPGSRIDEMDKIFSKLSGGEHLEHYETVRKTREGRLIDVSLTVSPIMNPAGEVIGASSIARDITDNKRTQEALRQSETQYRLLFESNPLPMWVFDSRTLGFLAVNESAVQHYGYSRQEFLEMTILDIRPTKDIPALLKATSHAGQGLQKPEIWNHRKKDGTIIDVEITSHDLDFHGTKAELVLANDITERSRNEERLRQSEERFSKAFRSSPLAITISTQAEGRYLDVNDAFRLMMGYERDELIGHTAFELKIWAASEDRAKMVDELRKSGRVNALETEYVSKQGEKRLVQVSAELIELDGTPCVLAITNDITAPRRLEVQFRQAQKMEAVGRLAGGVAHDFNNMLGVIIGYSDLIEESLDAENTVRKQVEQVNKAAHRAAALTKQLLAFSRQQILQPSVLNLNAVVNNLNKMLLHVIGEDISLSLIPGAPLGSVKADLGQIEQVLMNLVINARDAMPTGGKIIIETANAELDETYNKTHPPVQPGGYVMLSVSDTGCGMDPKTMSRIFEPFFTTKPPGQGTGLGLSMVYGVIKQSGGYIWVYSEAGKGTTFKMYFPRVEEPAESLVKPRISTTLAKGEETILLVEDDDALRHLTQGLLRNQGYTVLEAKDGHEAMTLSQQHQGTIDLLLTDVIMPELSGTELALRLKEFRPGLKVLCMSGYTGTLIAQQGIPNLEETLLQKPFTKISLLSHVRSALGKGS